MARPDGHGSHQHANVFGHKQTEFLVCQTISTLDGLKYFMYGPVEEINNNLTLLCQKECQIYFQNIQ